MFPLIDVNGMVGKRMWIREGSPKTTEDLEQIWSECGVSRVVVFHSAVKETDMVQGNEFLMKEIAGKEQFIPQWAVMPGVWEDFWGTEDLLCRMKATDVRTVRMFPQLHGHSLQPYAAGELIGALAECKVPIFIDRKQFASCDEIYQFCQNYPQAKLILCDTSYRELRWLCPILEQCPNFYLDTSSFIAHNGIREICRHYGAQRLLFGSGAPENSITAAVSLLRYADISKEEKEIIGGGNILSLLEEVRL